MNLIKNIRESLARRKAGKELAKRKTAPVNAEQVQETQTGPVNAAPIAILSMEPLTKQRSKYEIRSIALEFLPTNANPREYARILVHTSSKCGHGSSRPWEFIRDGTLPYFAGGADLNSGIRKYERIERYIPLSDLSEDTIKEIVGDVKQFSGTKLAAHCPSDYSRWNNVVSCCGQDVVVYTHIGAADGDLLPVEAKEKIEEIKKSGKIGNLEHVAHLYSRANNEGIAKELLKHNKNMGGNQHDIARLRTYQLESAEAKRKIFADEAKRIDGYRAEIRSLENSRDSEVKTQEAKIKDNAYAGNGQDLSSETRRTIRETVEPKYSPKIQELNQKIKVENFEAKAERLEAVVKKFEENPRSMSREEYKLYSQAARKYNGKKQNDKQ